MACTGTPSEISEKQQPVPNEQQPYGEDGVDVTLIRWMLSLTPSERLQVLQKNAQSLRRLIDEEKTLIALSIAAFKSIDILKYVI